jgi:hypothetical protein
VIPFRQDCCRVRLGPAEEFVSQNIPPPVLSLSALAFTSLNHVRDFLSRKGQDELFASEAVALDAPLL